MRSYPHKIRNLREARDLSQKEVAAALEITRPTYAAIETGKRDVSLGELRKLCLVLGLSLEQFLFSSSDTAPYEGKMDKFKQIILNSLSFGADTEGGHKLTKTKLAALVYISDFRWGQKYGYTMSGLSYRHADNGAVVDAYYRMIDDLYDEGAIRIELSGRAILIFANEPSAPSSLLTDEELNNIRTVAEKWQNLPTQEVVDFVKLKTPWKYYTRGEIIPDTEEPSLEEHGE